MHGSAMATGVSFFKHYSAGSKNVLELGSMNVNGALRDAAPKELEYLGVDLEKGPGVDQVISSVARLPFADRSFDLVVSSSCLEHDPFFWLTFLEMARVARRFVYISAPTQGPVHRHPVDCWRFYPDAGKALAMWARMRGVGVTLIESFLLPPTGDVWCDFVAVWGKEPPVGRYVKDDFYHAVEFKSEFPAPTGRAD